MMQTQKGMRDRILSSACYPVFKDRAPPLDRGTPLEPSLDRRGVARTIRCVKEGGVLTRTAQARQGGSRAVARGIPGVRGNLLIPLPLSRQPLRRLASTFGAGEGQPSIPSPGVPSSGGLNLLTDSPPPAQGSSYYPSLRNRQDPNENDSAVALLGVGRRTRPHPSQPASAPMPLRHAAAVRAAPGSGAPPRRASSWATMASRRTRAPSTSSFTTT